MNLWSWVNILTHWCLCARQNKKIARNHFLSNFEYEPDDFKHFQNFRACTLARRLLRARSALKVGTQFFCIELTSNTFLSRFTEFELLWTCNKAVRARQSWKSARAARPCFGKRAYVWKYPIFFFLWGLSKPKFSFSQLSKVIEI